MASPINEITLSSGCSGTNDAIGDDLFRKLQHFRRAGLRINIEFLANLCAEFCHCHWALQKFPNSCGNRIQAIIFACSDAEHHRLVFIDRGMKYVAVATEQGINRDHLVTLSDGSEQQVVQSLASIAAQARSYVCCSR